MSDLLPTTWEGGHALIVEYGDCELFAKCQCDMAFGSIRPNQSLDEFVAPWERHVMTEVKL